MMLERRRRSRRGKCQSYHKTIGEGHQMTPGLPCRIGPECRQCLQQMPGWCMSQRRWDRHRWGICWWCKRWGDMSCRRGRHRSPRTWLCHLELGLPSWRPEGQLDRVKMLGGEEEDTPFIRRGVMEGSGVEGLKVSSRSSTTLHVIGPYLYSFSAEFFFSPLHTKRRAWDDPKKIRRKIK